MILTTISSDFTRLATHRYAGSVFWISPFTRYYVLKSSGSFSISSFCLFGGFGLMAEEKELPSLDEKKNSSRIFPPPNLIELSWHTLAWSSFFLILHPILPAAWSFIFIIILSLIIMPNVAQWSLIVIYWAPIPNFKNCFPDKKVYRRKMIYLLIPVLTRDDVLSSYNRIWLARFGPIETRQSNV